MEPIANLTIYKLRQIEYTIFVTYFNDIDSDEACENGRKCLIRQGIEKYSGESTGDGRNKFYLKCAIS
jgi:hypothetical protein